MQRLAETLVNFKNDKNEKHGSCCTAGLLRHRRLWFVVRRTEVRSKVQGESDPQRVRFLAYLLGTLTVYGAGSFFSVSDYSKIWWLCPYRQGCGSGSGLIRTFLQDPDPKVFHRIRIPDPDPSLAI